MKCIGCNGEKSILAPCPICGKMLCTYCLDADKIQHERYPSEMSRKYKEGSAGRDPEEVIFFT